MDLLTSPWVELMITVLQNVKDGLHKTVGLAKAGHDWAFEWLSQQMILYAFGVADYQDDAMLHYCDLGEQLRHSKLGQPLCILL